MTPRPNPGRSGRGRRRCRHIMKARLLGAETVLSPPLFGSGGRLLFGGRHRKPLRTSSRRRATALCRHRSMPPEALISPAASRCRSLPRFFSVGKMGMCVCASLLLPQLFVVHLVATRRSISSPGVLPPQLSSQLPPTSSAPWLFGRGRTLRFLTLCHLPRHFSLRLDWRIKNLLSTSGRRCRFAFHPFLALDSPGRRRAPALLVVEFISLPSTPRASPLCSPACRVGAL